MSSPNTCLPARLSGEGLLLRLWTSDDVDAVAATIVRNTDHLRPWMPWMANEPLSNTDRAALISGWERDWLGGGDAVYGVFLGEEIVGGCGLHRRLGPNGLEIGYWTDALHLNQGIATRASRLLTDAALAAPGVSFVEIHHDKANAASARIPQHLGYTLIGETPTDPAAPAESGIHCVWRFGATP